MRTEFLSLSALWFNVQLGRLQILCGTLVVAITRSFSFQQGSSPIPCADQWGTVFPFDNKVQHGRELISWQPYLVHYVDQSIKGE